MVGFSQVATRSRYGLKGEFRLRSRRPQSASRTLKDVQALQRDRGPARGRTVPRPPLRRRRRDQAAADALTASRGTLRWGTAGWGASKERQRKGKMDQDLTAVASTSGKLRKPSLSGFGDCSRQRYRSLAAPGGDRPHRTPLLQPGRPSLGCA